jgi:hypothetical protein
MTFASPVLPSQNKLAVGILAAVVLMFAPSAALAQHGGGGGGHAGGGGGFGGGGGSHSSGSSSHASAQSSSHSTGSSTPHPAPVAHATPPVNSSVHPASASTSGRRVPGVVVAGPGGPVLLRNQAAPRNSVLGFAPQTSPWQFTPIHSGAMSFSGQGHDIWQDSTVRSAGTPASSAVIHPTTAQNSPRLLPVPPPRIFTNAPVQVVYLPFYGFFGPGFGFYGGGFGCDPFSGFGCFGYGAGFGYGFGGGFGYDSGDNSQYPVSGGPYLFSNDKAGDNADAAAGTDDNPSAWQNPLASNSVTAPAPSTLIYLKDGTIYEVMSYWLDAGKLHYITNYGGENAIDMNLLDLQQTVDANTQRGVTFTLRPAPAAQPAPDANPTPDAPPDTAPAPQK